MPVGVAAVLQNPTHMLQFHFLNSFKVVMAPLWMRSGLSEFESSSVCVESYNLMKLQDISDDITTVDDVINEEFAIDFKTLSLTTATWQDIVPRWTNPNEERNVSGQGLTFQLLIATDYVSTYLVTSYDGMITFSRYSEAEYTHALGPAVFKGKIEKNDAFAADGDL